MRKLTIWYLIIATVSVSVALFSGYRAGRRAGRWDGYNFLLERSKPKSDPNYDPNQWTIESNVTPTPEPNEVERIRI